MFIRRSIHVLCILVALGLVPSAGATTPGANGRIAFSSDRDGNPELYSVASDGTSARRLTWTSATEQAPAWSPDGTKIAYERASSDFRFRIWVMNADGSAQTQISPDTSDLGDDTDPAWSPDGMQIAFGSTRGGTWNLWLINADGSGLRRITDVHSHDPSWSPDGRQLAYVGLNGIGIVDADGRNAHAISGPGTFPSAPSWSPDGLQIVFARNDGNGYPGELYLANTDGSGEIQLTNGGFNNARPAWSPDGTMIVFQRTAQAPFGWQLWTAGADGLGTQQLTFSQDDLGPAWGTSQIVPEPSPPDAPTIEIYSPVDGGLYFPGDTRIAFYLCTSFVTFVISCEGDVPHGEELDLRPGTHTFTVHALDSEGRTATKSVTYRVFDLVAPQIDLRTPLDGGTYDLGAEVTVDYSCSDPGGSGIAECAGDLPNGARLHTDFAGTRSFNVIALDKEGNLSRAKATYTIVDRRPPSIHIAYPNDGAPYFLGSTILASYDCRSVSGARVTTCDGTVPNGSPIDTASVGPHSFEVSASDENGRSAKLTHTYTVVYDFRGFDSPVDANRLVDNAKAGEAIPLKFTLGGAQGLNVIVATTWYGVSCTDWVGTGSSSDGQGKLTYNATTGKYTYLAATNPGWKGSCRLVRLDFADGTYQGAYVRFKR